MNESFSPEFWSEHDMQMEEYGKEHGFILKAPAAKGAEFRCPESHVTEFLHIYSDFNHSSYTVTPDGRLRGYNISYQHQQITSFGNFTWDNDKFCVSYVDADYDYESEDYKSDGVFQFTINACYDNSRPGNCQSHLDFLSNFKPISLCISIFFLLLTIEVFIWYKNINVWERSNMMKIAFLLNLTIAYIVR